MSIMARKKRRKSPPEFRAEAIRLVNTSEKSLTQVAKELGIAPQTLNAWVLQAEVDGGGGSPEQLTTTEREELARLRRENSQLREDVVILKKATAFFAKENK